MSAPELGDVTSIVGGGAGVVVLAKYLWDSVRQRKEHLESQRESSAELKLDKLVEGQGRLELELRDMRNALHNQNGEMGGLRDRVNGMSADYSARLKDLELWRAGLDANKGVEPKGRRR